MHDLWTVQYDLVLIQICKQCLKISRLHAGYKISGCLHKLRDLPQDIKDAQGWQFLTIEAAENLCIVCSQPEEHIFRKKYLGNRPFKKSHSVRV